MARRQPFPRPRIADCGLLYRRGASTFARPSAASYDLLSQLGEDLLVFDDLERVCQLRTRWWMTIAAEVTPPR